MNIHSMHYLALGLSVGSSITLALYGLQMFLIGIIHTSNGGRGHRLILGGLGQWVLMAISEFCRFNFLPVINVHAMENLDRIRFSFGCIMGIIFFTYMTAQIYNGFLEARKR